MRTSDSLRKLRPPYLNQAWPGPVNSFVLTPQVGLGVLKMKFIFAIFVIYYQNLMSKVIVNTRFWRQK